MARRRFTDKDDTYNPYVTDEYWEAYDGGNNFEDTKFTHWMPLPAPPAALSPEAKTGASPQTWGQWERDQQERGK